MKYTADLQKSLQLYAVTDRRYGQGTLAERIAAALKGGVTMVQLREKHLSAEEFMRETKEIGQITVSFHVPLIINDCLGAALCEEAAGLHIGQTDMEAGTARKALGPEKILGISAATLEEALAAEAAGADYLGVGAIFPTATKTDARTVSLTDLRKICQTVKIPVVAIGGLGTENLLLLKGSGIAGAAVVSSLFAAPDIAKAAATLKQQMEEITGGATL